MGTRGAAEQIYPITALRRNRARLSFLEKPRDFDKISPYEKEKWEVLIGPLDVYLEKMKREGLAREASLSEIMTLYLRVSDLKEIASQHSLKKSGVKAELIQRLIQFVPESDLIRIVGTHTMYSLTDLGRSRLKAQCEDEETEAISRDREIYNHLLRKDVKSAIEAFSDWQKKQVHPEYIHHIPEEIKFALNDSHIHFEGPEELSNSLPIVIAHYLVIGSRKNIGMEITSKIGDSFSCPSLEEVIKDGEGQTIEVRMASIDDKKNIARIYGEYYLARARMSVHMARMKKDLKENAYIRVVEVSNTSGDNCLPRKRIYKKSEMNQLEPLPHTWGCRCWANVRM